MRLQPAPFYLSIVVYYLIHRHRDIGSLNFGEMTASDGPNIDTERMYQDAGMPSVFNGPVTGLGARRLPPRVVEDHCGEARSFDMTALCFVMSNVWSYGTVRYI